MTHLLLATLLFAAQPTDTTKELLRTFRSEFVAITPGTGDFPSSFLMGSAEGHPAEQPAHRVHLKYAFAMARYEMPQNLYEAVMGNNPSRWKGPRNSVEMITFHDAQEFCKRATTLMRQQQLIAEDEEIRLPTEAEWEYCARAGTTTAYSFGDDASKLDEYGWHNGNAAGNDPPVGAKKPNPWGLYDMHGYLWEWCLDAAHSNYEGAPADGSAWLTGGEPKRRVLRGGSWKDPADALRSAARAGSFRSDAVASGMLTFAGGAPAELRDDAVGFRCVLAKRSTAP